MATQVREAGVTHRSWLFGGTQAIDFRSVLVISFVIALIDTWLMLSSDRFEHWFLAPISVCGILIAIDALDWFSGRIDLYDPIGLIGVFGIHYFYVAPLLHIYWNGWVVDASPPADWRKWLGYMAILNAIGLVLYRAGREVFSKRAGYRGVFWAIDKARFRIVLPFAILLSLVTQTLVYAKFGGISGYMETRMTVPSGFAGMGWVFMISESAPILIAFFVIMHVQQQKINWFIAAAAFVLLFSIQMYFGGLRGSRSETLQLFFWVVGCVHFLVRPVPRKMIYVGCIFFMAFLYLYGFYKNMGTNAGQALTASAEDREYMAQKEHRTFRGLILGDLARADLQAFILYRLCSDDKDFDYALGRTYLGALALWIPHWILPNRPYTKDKEGTEIQYGSGYDPESKSSHVYGMAAEAMFNFGPVAAPLFYGVFGLFIGWFRRAVDRLRPGDMRLLLIPFLVFACQSVLTGDSDNLAFGLAKNGLMALIVIAICSTRHPFYWPSVATYRMRERSAVQARIPQQAIANFPA